MQLAEPVKEIPLTRGQVAIVDAEDWEWLSKRKWYARWSRHSSGYYAETKLWNKRKKKYQTYQMSRVIMNTVPFLDCDHINHNILDNRRENLRNVSHRKNCENRKKRARYGPGIVFEPRCTRRPFQMRFEVDGKLVSLGFFATPKEALEAKEKYFRERTNL